MRGTRVLLVASIAGLLLAPAAGMQQARADDPPVARAAFNGDLYFDLAIGIPGEAVGPETSAGAVSVLRGRSAGLSYLYDQLWHQDVDSVLDVAEASDAFGDTLAAGDFDGDGYLDLAVGVPGEDLAVMDAGVVHALYGGTGGVSATDDQLWHQGSAGIADAPEAGDRFGKALATGDFDGDGYADLAIGVPSEGLDGLSDVGCVQVLYGSGHGLQSSGNQLWYQGTPGVLDVQEASDQFGWALATGDFDGDGYADLAVGTPYEDTGGASAAGAVNVLYGSPSGLTATGSQFWSQDAPGVLDACEPNDNFGMRLAAGDFNGDGRDDLAVGVPNEDVETVANAGAVNVLYGSSSGLTATGNQFWHQNVPGMADSVEAGDLFGHALAAGDFNGDGRDDLAVGVPHEDVGTVANAGGVAVLRGSSGGLTATGNQFVSQDSGGIEDACEAEDRFGWALATGDFNRDGRADLAVGVPYEDVGSVVDAGAINVLYGSPGGLASAGNQLWHQDSSGIEGVAEEPDRFGYSLASGMALRRVYLPSILRLWP